MTAPTVTVEVAFTSTFSTPEGSRVWTDITSYVEAQTALSIAFGRNDERSQADANGLNLVLDNRDGRFTPEKTTGAYYPNVKLYRPIRITAQYPAGVAQRRFTGYVLTWKPEWEGGSDAMAQVSVAGASRIKRLGQADELRSVVEETILTDRPRAYYTMSEAAEATSASESSGNNRPPLGPTGTGAAVTFGGATGPGTDGLTAAQFNAGQTLTAPNSVAPAGTPETLECYISTTGAAPTGTPEPIVTGSFGEGIYLDNSGRPVIAAPAGSSLGYLAGPSAINDGAVHHLAVTISGAGAGTLYVDGASVASGAFGGTVSGGNPLTVGSANIAAGISHVAVHDSALSSTRIADRATAGSTGFAGETTAARAVRYLSWRGVPSAEVDTSGTTRTVQHFDPSGSSLLDALQILESTEGGVLYDGRDGHTRLIGESGRYVATSSFTLDIGEQYVTADFAPEYDDSQLLNDVTVESTDGTSARSVNTSSVDAYGRVSESSRTASTSSDAPADDAAWLVARYAEPATRLASVTVNVHSVTDTTLREAVVAADVGTLLTISSLPTQFASSSGTWFVEGYTEEFGVGTHDITFNLSPSSPYTSAFLLDSGSRGVLDTNPLGH